eukprot:8373073-Karenia_brevis.AAC.1
MLEDLIRECGSVGLTIHFGKTKILHNSFANTAAVRKLGIQGGIVDVLGPNGSTLYLGRKFCFEGLHDCELDHRINRGWQAFMAKKDILCNKAYKLQSRLKLFGATVSQSVLYGSGTWTMTFARERRLQSTQRRMMRLMLGAGPVSYTHLRAHETLSDL